MDIAINAKVLCSDGECGHVYCVIVHPIHKEITHIVVQESAFLGPERLVPVSYIQESTSDKIVLSCTQNDLVEMENFTESHFVGADESFEDYDAGHYYVHPYLVPGPDLESGFEVEPLIIEEEKIPSDEFGLHRGSRVNATDGAIGKVDEFLINPDDNKITHLVLREGHLWGKKNITIPVNQIDHIEEDTVFLRLDRKAIKELPSIPVHRHLGR